MEDYNSGYVYILTNPSFREDWVKIGKSSRPVDVRSKKLDNTAVPLPFEIYATLKTSKYDKVSSAPFVQEQPEEVVTASGVPIPIPLGDEQPFVFTLTQKKLEAVATLHYYRISKRFILKAGSKIKAMHDSSCLQGHIALRKKVFSDPELCTVDEKVATLLKDSEIPELNSPSALAIFCCGGSRNGPKSWADKDKKKYDAKWWAGEDAPIELATSIPKEQIG